MWHTLCDMYDVTCIAWPAGMTGVILEILSHQDQNFNFGFWISEVNMHVLTEYVIVCLYVIGENFEGFTQYVIDYQVYGWLPS